MCKTTCEVQIASAFHEPHIRCACSVKNRTNNDQRNSNCRQLYYFKPLHANKRSEIVFKSVHHVNRLSRDTRNTKQSEVEKLSKRNSRKYFTVSHLFGKTHYVKVIPHTMHSSVIAQLTILSIPSDDNTLNVGYLIPLQGTD